MSARSSLLASASNAIAAGVGSASSFALTIYIARDAGLRLLGEYALLAAVYGVLLVVDSARTQDLTTRFAGRLGNEPPRVRLIAVAGAGLVATVGAILFGALTTPSDGGAAAIAWLAAAAQIGTAELAAGAQTAGRFQRLATATAGASLASSIVGALLLRPLGIWGLGIGLAANTFVFRVGLAVDREVRGYLSTRDRGLKPAASQTLSLTLLGGAAQLLNVTDALAIRTLASAAQVGIYRAAAQLPTQTIGLIYRGYDIVIVRMAGTDAGQAASVARRTAPWLGAINGLLLGSMIGFRHSLVDLVLGRTDHDAQTVLILFAAFWLANSLVHPASLLLIARRRQQSIVRLIWMEYVANLILTIALVPSLGARGSAIASLATLVASNIIVLPRLLQRELPELPVVRHLLVESLLPTALAAAAAIGFAAIA